MVIEKSRDPDAFAAFELVGWDANIAGYDQAFGVVARQTVSPILEATRVGSGTGVLDVCCGPGILAAGALARGAEVIGLDFASEAVALARRTVPFGRFQQGNAQALPFTDARFDAVVCGYGLMHLPDPAIALREMLRVLRPGGRVGVSVWDAGGVGFSLVYEAVRAKGEPNVPLPHGPDFFQFGTVAKMEATLIEAGFTDVCAESFDQSWQVRDANGYVAAILGGTVRARAVLAAQTGSALANVHAYIAQYLTRFAASDGTLIVPMPAVIGSGTRPDPK
jgi:SAM-dependent methyltransferase